MKNGGLPVNRITGEYISRESWGRSCNGGPGGDEAKADSLREKAVF